MFVTLRARYFCCIGAAQLNAECHTAFVDPSATASDSCDPAPAVAPQRHAEHQSVGTYTVTYTATDASGNHSSITREVVVVDTTAPVVTLNGASSVTVECHGASVIRARPRTMRAREA